MDRDQTSDPASPAATPSPRWAQLPERSAVALLLVRAVEEHDHPVFTSEVRSAAALAAIDARSDVELLEKRTAYLFLCLPPQIRAWARLALLPEYSLSVVVLGTVLVGVSSSYLGPSGVVHVAYNPLALLIVWNLGVYGVLAWRRLARRPGAGRSVSPATDTGRTAPEPHPTRAGGGAAGTSRRHGVLATMLPFWFTWHRWLMRVRGARAEVTNAGRIAARFWEAYWAAARSVIILRAESLIHVGAMSLFLGAVLGTYVRGLFFEYNAVWRSTFLTDATAVAVFLNVLLGPACVLLNGTLLTPEAVAPLLSPQGMIAAAWLHRLALTGVLVIVVPRAFLAGHTIRRARTSASRVEIDVSQPYYAETIRAARQSQIHRARDSIATAIHRQVGKFSESVAIFVRDRFFDTLVAPTLLRFRDEGGRIADLEAELSEHRRRFEGDLAEHLRVAQQEFDQGIRASARSVVGRELAHHPRLPEGLSAGTVSFHQDLPASVAARLGDALGTTATAGATAAVAAVSGGVGKGIGVAVVSSLLGVSGPIGLLIGGVVALAAVGGTYLLGRDRVTAAIKASSLPAFLVAMALRDAKIEQAREATYFEVQQDIARRLEPHVAPMVEAMLQHVSQSVFAIERGTGPA